MLPLLRLRPGFVIAVAACACLSALFYAYGRSHAKIVSISEVAQAETVYFRVKSRTDTVRQETVRWVDRWRVDTAYRADTVTLRDTLRVLVPLAQFDSTIRACSELASSCERERAAAERLHLALRDSIQRLQPSKWAPVKTALVFGAGIVIGGLVR